MTNPVSTSASPPQELDFKKRLLIIDDDEPIRDTLKYLLEEEGYEVFTAIHGKMGLEWLMRIDQLPDLIILDLTMPVMNGTEFLEHQKSNPKLAPIPVILFTAATASPHGTKADEFIRKPIRLEDLLKVISRFCGTSSAK